MKIYNAKILSLFLEIVKENYWKDYHAYLQYPAGKLYISNRSDGRKEYYLEASSKRQYLSYKKDKTKIELYCQKESLKKRINENCRELIPFIRANNNFIAKAIREMQSRPFNRSFPITESQNPYYRENLKHKTVHGEYVRSKSEVIIANILFERGLKYQYEMEFRVGDTVLYPDFTITDPYTEEIYLLEHLGMLSKKNYQERWQQKKIKYEAAGIFAGKKLLITTEDNCGNIDSNTVIKMLDDTFSVNRYDLLLVPIEPVS